MKFKIHSGTADRVAANLTLSQWPGIVKLLHFIVGIAVFNLSREFHFVRNRSIGTLILMRGFINYADKGPRIICINP